MSESGVGVSVAWIRQKAGRALKPEAATPGGAPKVDVGGWKPPAGTRTADVTLPSGSAAPARSPQSLAAAGPASATPPAIAIAAAAVVHPPLLSLGRAIIPLP